MGSVVTPVKSNKGSIDGQFIEGIAHQESASLDEGGRSEGPRATDGTSPGSMLGNERQHPGRRFFNHVAEFSGGAACGHLREDRATANVNGSERMVGAVRRMSGQYAGNFPAQRRAIRQVDRVTHSQLRKLSEHLGEDRRHILRRERLIDGPIVGLLEELGQEFPKYLAVYSAEQAELASPGEEVEQSQGAADIEFPRREEQGTVAMMHFKRWLAGIVRLVKRPFCPLQLSGNDLLAEARGFIGKCRGCGRPAGRDGITGRQLPGPVKPFERKHVLVGKKLKREIWSGSEQLQPCPFRMQRAAEP